MGILGNWEDTKSKLVEKGISEEDIDIAARLASAIALLDSLVFPYSNGETFEIGFNHKREAENFAEYRPRTRKEKDGYLIFTRGLFEKLSEEAEHYYLFDSNRGFSSLSNSSFEGGCSLDEMIVSVAAHEVRHKLQFNRPELGRFSRRGISLIRAPLVRAVVYFEHSVFRERRKIYIKEERPKSFIRRKLSRIEFDAHVVDRMVGSIIRGQELSQVLGKHVALLIQIDLQKT